MLNNEIRKFILGMALAYIPLSILSMLFDNSIWVDIVIATIVVSPIYIKIARRLDVKVM